MSRPLNLKHIKKLCKAATGGAWSSTQGCGPAVYAGAPVAIDEAGHVAIHKGGFMLFELDPDNYVREETLDDGFEDEDGSLERAQADCDFIAHLNPSTVMLLVKEIETLRARLKSKCP